MIDPYTFSDKYYSPFILTFVSDGPSLMGEVQRANWLHPEISSGRQRGYLCEVCYTVT